MFDFIQIYIIMWQDMESLEYGLYTIAYSKEEALTIMTDLDLELREYENKGD